MCMYVFRSEIHSGTVVTYNDRQEILCQKCTDIALHEEQDDLLPSGSSNNASDGRSSSTDGRGSGNLTDGRVSASLTDGRGSGANSRSGDRLVSFQ